MKANIKLLNEELKSYQGYGAGGQLSILQQFLNCTEFIKQNADLSVSADR